MQRYDTAIYSWDWNFQGTHAGDATGYSVSKSYNDPGDRVVRLFVSDQDGAGYTNDTDVADTLTVKVRLTMETDWMSGYSIVETGLSSAVVGRELHALDRP